MFEFQVFNAKSRKYRTIRTSQSFKDLALDMTLPHVHEGARRRIRRDGKVLVQR